MRRQSSAPATKQDITLIMGSIGKLYDANERWKNEILEANDQWTNKIRQEMVEWKQETMRHFDVVAEQLTHDFQGALKDKISVHDDHLQRNDQRITKIETHLHLTA